MALQYSTDPYVDIDSVYANPRGHRPNTFSDLFERLRVGSLFNDSPCLEWVGASDKDGYGILNYRGRQWKAHRFFYTQTVDPIPAGLVLDHLCRDPSCCNPLHLEAVTTEENLRRGLHRIPMHKTHCINGHEFNEINTRRMGELTFCRRCQSERYYAKLGRVPGVRLPPITHCQNGHPFDEANTGRQKNGARYCKTCERLRKRRNRQ